MNSEHSVSKDDSAIERLERNLALLKERIRLLEEENARLEGLLGERGITARRASKFALELPPPIADRSSALLAQTTAMSEEESKLFEEAISKDEALLALRSGSKADVGRWFRRASVWVCAGSKEIILLAAGPKPFVQKTPFRFLRESLYNHVTGQVVLAPASDLAMRSFKLPPLEGYQVLAQIYADNNQEK